jgi:DNA polymerase
MNMRKEKLQKIAEEIARCKECKKSKSGLPVPGEGNPNSKIIFLGEAPGYKESETGRPFVGRAGKFLNKMLDKIGIERKDIFITSPVKYFPGRRAPSPEEIRHGMVHTKKQIEVIKPRIVVLMGNVALHALIDENLKISQVHGKVIEKDGIKYFPTFHPSAAMRFTKVRLRMEKDFKKVKSILV